MALTRKAGRLALAAITSTALLTSVVPAPAFADNGTPAANSTSDQSLGQKGVKTPQGYTPKVEVGDGSLKVDKEEVKAGEVVTVTGTGFAAREKNQGMVLKFVDGTHTITNPAFALPKNQDPASLTVEKGSIYGSFNPDKLPGKEGKFEVKVRVPDTVPNGWYWLRVLGGSQNHGTPVSKLIWIKITGSTAKLSDTFPDATSKLGGITHLDRKTGKFYVTYDLTFKNVPAETKLKAGYTGPGGAKALPIVFKGGHGQPDSDTYQTTSEADSVVVKVPVELTEKGEALAYTGHTIVFTNTENDQVLFSFRPKAGTLPYVGFKDPNHPDTTNASINSTSKVTIFNLQPGDTIDAIMAGNKNLLSGKKTIGNDFRTTFDLTIPNDPSIVGRQLKVKLHSEDAAKTYETGIYVTADNTEFGRDNLTITKHELDRGLYQSAYSAKQKALYVTRTDFAGKTGSILKLDPQSFKVLAKVDTKIDAKDPKTEKAAAFGITVDDVHDQVWVSNTLGNSVAAYQSKDLKLIKQFPLNDDGFVTHPREIAVNATIGRVYVSAPISDREELVTYDEKTMQPSTRPTPGFHSGMGLAVNDKTNILYSVSREMPKIVGYDTYTNDVSAMTIEGDVLVGGSDVAVDTGRNRIYAVAQTSGNLTVFDANGRFVKAIGTGTGALSVAYDKTHDKIFVANRDAGTVTVVDGKTLEVVANLKLAAHPNDISVSPDGKVFVLTKSSQVDGSATDAAFELTWKGGGSDRPTPPPPGGDGDQGGQGHGGHGNGGQGDEPNTPSNSGSASSSQGGGALLPILGVLGVVAAAIGGVITAAASGALPPQVVAMIPAPIRHMLRI